jgi:hypothetical protein
VDELMADPPPPPPPPPPPQQQPQPQPQQPQHIQPPWQHQQQQQQQPGAGEGSATTHVVIKIKSAQASKRKHEGESGVGSTAEGAPRKKKAKEEADAAPAPAAVLAFEAPPVPKRELAPFEAAAARAILRLARTEWGGKYFGRPVLESYPDLAELYMAVVPRPRDLRTILAEVYSGKVFTRLASVDYDVRLMFDNAFAFNADDGLLATRNLRAQFTHLQKYWEHVSCEAAEMVAQAAGGADAGPEAEQLEARRARVMSERESAVAGVDASEFKSSIVKLIKKITHVRNKDCHLFLEPVDTARFPGYTEVVARPMDLSTLKGGFLAGKYNAHEGRPGMGGFAEDARLVFSNCLLFNAETVAENAYIRGCANRMSALFEAEWAVLCADAMEKLDKQRLTREQDVEVEVDRHTAAALAAGDAGAQAPEALARLRDEVKRSYDEERSKQKADREARRSAAGRKQATAAGQGSARARGADGDGASASDGDEAGAGDEYEPQDDEEEEEEYNPASRGGTGRSPGRRAGAGGAAAALELLQQQLFVQQQQQSAGSRHAQQLAEERRFRQLDSREYKEHLRVVAAAKAQARERAATLEAARRDEEAQARRRAARDAERERQVREQEVARHVVVGGPQALLLPKPLLLFAPSAKKKQSQHQQQQHQQQQWPPEEDVPEREQEQQQGPPSEWQRLVMRSIGETARRDAAARAAAAAAATAASATAGPRAPEPVQILCDVPRTAHRDAAGRLVRGGTPGTSASTVSPSSPAMTGSPRSPPPPGLALAAAQQRRNKGKQISGLLAKAVPRSALVARVQQRLVKLPVGGGDNPGGGGSSSSGSSSVELCLGEVVLALSTTEEDLEREECAAKEETRRLRGPAEADNAEEDADAGEETEAATSPRSLALPARPSSAEGGEEDEEEDSLRRRRAASLTGRRRSKKAGAEALKRLARRGPCALLAFSDSLEGASPPVFVPLPAAASAGEAAVPRVPLVFSTTALAAGDADAFADALAGLAMPPAPSGGDMALLDAELVFARRFLAGPAQDAADLAQHEAVAAAHAAAAHACTADAAQPVQLLGGAWAAHLAQGLLTAPPELQERGSRACVSVRFIGIAGKLSVRVGDRTPLLLARHEAAQPLR